MNLSKPLNGNCCRRDGHRWTRPTARGRDGGGEEGGGVGLPGRGHARALLPPGAAAGEAGGDAQALAKVCREEAVDEGVGCRVEGGEGLDEGGHCLAGWRVGDQPIHLHNKEQTGIQYVPVFQFFTDRSQMQKLQDKRAEI